MARMPQGPGEDNSVYIVIGGVILILGATWLWGKHSPAIYTFLLGLADLEAIPFLAFPGMDGFHEATAELDPASMTFAQMNAVLDTAGRWYGLIMAVVLVFFLARGYNMSARERYRRTLNMKTLLQNNGKLYPCIMPILNWGRSILEEPTDSGPWMVGRQPIQFVAMHGLLKDSAGKAIPSTKLLGSNNIANPESPVITGAIQAHFDRDAAQAAFEQQFSPLFQGLGKLPSYLYALAAAFMLYGVDRKDDAQLILDNMSITFRPPDRGTKARFTWKPPFYIPARAPGKRYSMSTHVHVSKQEILKIWNSEAVQNEIQAHNRYRDHVLLALYAFARRKGVIASSEFIWLRPVNRRLYYLLNNYGRRSVWPEIAGPWVHYQLEDAVRLRLPSFEGRDLEKMEVENAVNALELAMYEEGWIHGLSLSDDEYGLMGAAKDKNKGQHKAF